MYGPVTCENNGKKMVSLSKQSFLVVRNSYKLKCIKSMERQLPLLMTYSMNSPMNFLVPTNTIQTFNDSLWTVVAVVKYTFYKVIFCVNSFTFMIF